MGTIENTSWSLHPGKDILKFVIIYTRIFCWSPKVGWGHSEGDVGVVVEILHRYQ